MQKKRESFCPRILQLNIFEEPRTNTVRTSALKKDTSMSKIIRNKDDFIFGKYLIIMKILFILVLYKKMKKVKLKKLKFLKIYLK